MRHLRVGVGFALLLVGLLGGSNVLAADPPSPPAPALTIAGAAGDTVHIAPARGVLGTPAANVSPQAAVDPAPVVTAAGAAVVTGNGIDYHNGPVIPLQNVVAIYWGSSRIYANGPTPGTVGGGS